MEKIATYTLGCKVNQYETRAIEEMFINKGYDIVPFDNKADIYIINTCTVTSISDRKSRQIIRRAKNISPNSKIVVIGCYSQNSPEEVANIKDVNLVIGTTDKQKIVQEVENITKDSKKIMVRDIFEQKDFEDINISSTSAHTRAFLKIQDGCDRYCSYCIIPYTRGKVRSKKKEKIIDEVRILSDNGYKEIVLTGIHLASYGKDLKDEKLESVIKEINKIDGIKRIRLGSVEPMLINEEFLSEISRCDKFCPNFHLSLQSGSDETLKRMNRRYTAEEFYKSVVKIRDYYPNAMLTTDIIVGFPGETEEEFTQTYKYLKKIKFYQTHIFKFSPRKGTKAYEMPEKISPQIKSERSKILLSLSEKNKSDYEEKMIGSIEEVLFEEMEDGYYTGHTKNFVKVYISSIQDLSGKIKSVKIVDRKEGRLIGIIV